MFRAPRLLLGKWEPLDFLRGKGKGGCHGWVHRKSTLGSRGRVKRWHKHHGMREGLPHDQNNLKGTLGVRLGGGLFGARTPMGVYAHISKEAADIVQHGHPSITNTYKDILEEHPDLDAVVAGPKSRRATVAFPLAMWDMSALPDDVTRSAETLREFRAAERKYVVNAACRFLTSSLSSWSERTIIVGSPKRCVALSLAELEARFFFARPEQQQQQKEENNAEGKTKTENVFPDFVRQQVAAACKRCVAFAPAGAVAVTTKASGVDGDHHSNVHDMVVLNENFLDVVQRRAPHSLRLILRNASSSSSSSSASNITSSSRNNNNSNNNNTNEVVKWFMRAHDPRGHIAEGGHTNRHFNIVCVCPFAPLHTAVFNGLSKGGFMKSTASSNSVSTLLNQVAHIVVDDSETRVPLSSLAAAHHPAGQEGEEAEEEEEEVPSIASAKTALRMFRAENKAAKMNGRTPLLPHLTRPLTLHVRNVLAEREADPLHDPDSEFARSYFSS